MTRFNLYLGASVSAWLLVVLVIMAELAEPFKTFLKTAFIHHWIGKGVIMTLAFAASGFLLRQKSHIGRVRDDKMAWYSVIGSLAAIFLFYVAEFFL